MQYNLLKTPWSTFEEPIAASIPTSQENYLCLAVVIIQTAKYLFRNMNNKVWGHLRDR